MSNVLFDFHFSQNFLLLIGYQQVQFYFQQDSVHNLSVTEHCSCRFVIALYMSFCVSCMLDRYKAMTDPEEAPAPPASPAILGKKTS